MLLLARAPANVAVYHDPVVSAAAAVDLAVVDALLAVGVLELSAVAGVPISITLFLFLSFSCCWRSAVVGVPAFATILLLLTALHLLLMLAALKSY